MIRFFFSVAVLLAAAKIVFVVDVVVVAGWLLVEDDCESLVNVNSLSGLSNRYSMWYFLMYFFWVSTSVVS